MADPAETQPGDAELLAGLDPSRVEEWRALRSVGTGLTERDRAPEWVLGPGFPYPDYSDRVRAAIRLLAEVGAVSPRYDWRRGATEVDPDTPLSAADAVRVATALVRGERFCDGLIGRALRDGTLSAVLAALSRWYAAQAEPAPLQGPGQVGPGSGSAP